MLLSLLSLITIKYIPTQVHVHVGIYYSITTGPTSGTQCRFSSGENFASNGNRGDIIDNVLKRLMHKKCTRIVKQSFS